MAENVYVLDTSSIINLFDYHPPEIYPVFWQKLETYLQNLFHDGRLILLKWVDKELTDLGYSVEADDPSALWMKNHAHYVIPDAPYIVLEAQTVLKTFPNLINPNAEKEQADPFLVGYVLHHTKAQTTFEKTEYIIITEEKRKINPEKFCKLSPEQLKIQGKHIPSVCDWYKIRTMNYLHLFLTEGWTF